MTRDTREVRVIASKPPVDTELLGQLPDRVDCFRITSHDSVPRVRNDAYRVDVRSSRAFRGDHIAIPRPQRKSAR